MKLKFLHLLYDLVKHISTKFRGIWIGTLGDITFSLKGTESARKVTFIRYIWSHFD
jgi:RNA-splicing ligase RtcB